MAMMDVGETMVWVVRHTLRTCLRGMALALAAVAWLPLFFASVVCVLLLPTGLGVVLAPKSLLAVRRQAERQRRWALEWSGVTIAAPYRSRSAKPANRLLRVFRRCGWVLGDPATWRDLLWTLVNVPVSAVLGLLPAFMLVAFTWTVVAELLALVDSAAVGAVWDSHHPHRMGERAADVWANLGPRILLAQVKDARPDPGRDDGWQLVLLGQGEVPVRDMLALLSDGGYRGWVSVEWEKRWHPELAAPEVALPQYLATLGSWLEEGS